MDLLERLIEEARLHGVARFERDKTIQIAEDAADALAKTIAQMQQLQAAHATLERTAIALRDEVHASRSREQAALIEIRALITATDAFTGSGLRRHGKPFAAITLAKGTAMKFVDAVEQEAQKPGALFG